MRASRRRVSLCHRFRWLSRTWRELSCRERPLQAWVFLRVSKLLKTSPGPACGRTSTPFSERSLRPSLLLRASPWRRASLPWLSEPASSLSPCLPWAWEPASLPSSGQPPSLPSPSWGRAFWLSLQIWRVSLWPYEFVGRTTSVSRWGSKMRGVTYGLSPTTARGIPAFFTPVFIGRKRIGIMNSHWNSAVMRSAKTCGWRRPRKSRRRRVARARSTGSRKRGQGAATERSRRGSPG